MNNWGEMKKIRNNEPMWQYANLEDCLDFKWV